MMYRNWIGALLLVLLFSLGACKSSQPSIYQSLEDCKYQKDARYVNVALAQDGALYLEKEQLRFSELYPALVQLKRERYQSLRKKERGSQRYFVINFCSHPEADYARLLKVKGILERWDAILVN